MECSVLLLQEWVLPETKILLITKFKCTHIHMYIVEQHYILYSISRCIQSSDIQKV